MFPSSVDEKSHCGLRYRFSSGTYLGRYRSITDIGLQEHIRTRNGLFCHEISTEIVFQKCKVGKERVLGIITGWFIDLLNGLAS